MLHRIVRKVRSEGIGSLADAAARHFRGGKIAGFSSIVHPAVAGKYGIEIGGPSHHMFGAGRYLPAYPVAAGIDNCNFSDHTTWEGQISEGRNFIFNDESPIGFQFINDGTDLSNIPDAHYDFLLSSHTLEHIANPLKALREWRRIVKPAGLLIVVVPQKENIFDHRRGTTPLEHMIEDEQLGVGEDDLSHVGEIVTFHDRSMDEYSGDAKYFRKRSMDNFKTRCLHHHTFTMESAEALLQYAGLKLLVTKVQRPWHLISVCRN